ncbi:hypothetical protein [Aequorivita sp. CIP111184]|uniref:hypothetical protein n=1 Tax=Aequorivita sp. CIP111184 TaxID=2211356 RepID=UPI000DBBF009|nr:hypothetical protein [Aequorivita sp. CIP111184]SRX54855.1 hypothetical protein AEQU1_01873 [Aequorivita sp. CIP111184]
MKKIIAIFLSIIIIVLIIIYFSIWSTPAKVASQIIVNTENINTLNFKEQDSVTIAVTTMYEGNMLKNMVQGEQYRDEWAIPVKVPVVFLDTLNGGLTIIKKGGGHQTQSLRLKNPKGIYYTLRSVAKNPEPLIPEFAKTLGIENIIIDGISAQHPYGAIVVAKLAESISILHTHPSLVFVPKQERLGKYNTKYGNKLYWLEYETEGPTNWTDIENVKEIVDTDKLQKLKKQLGNDLNIKKEELVRNRLFDLVIGDWDRHAKQWGWVLQQREDKFLAIPLPGDRDNAFFSTDGVIPTIVSSKNIQPRLRSFEKEIDYIPGLVYPFDRYFLLNIPIEIFIEQAEFIQNNLTDQAIEEALHIWPKEIYKLHGAEIKTNIIARRGQLVAYAKAFKKEIDRQGILHEPLKGSDDVVLSKELLECFDCR